MHGPARWLQSATFLNGELGGKSTLARIRGVGAAYRRLDDALQSPEFLRAISALTGIDALLYDP